MFRKGVVVGDGSDISGGCLHHGHLVRWRHGCRNSIGEHSLLSANASISISLGDNCTVETSLATSPPALKITIWDKAKARPLANRWKLKGQRVLKALRQRQHSGIRNSVNSRIKAPLPQDGVELNAKLHKNWELK